MQLFHLHCLPIAESHLSLQPFSQFFSPRLYANALQRGHHLEKRIINQFGDHLYGSAAKAELSLELFRRLHTLSKIFKDYRPSDDLLCISLVKIQAEFSLQQVMDKQVSLELQYPVSECKLEIYLCGFLQTTSPFQFPQVPSPPPQSEVSTPPPQQDDASMSSGSSSFTEESFKFERMMNWIQELP